MLMNDEINFIPRCNLILSMKLSSSFIGLIFSGGGGGLFSTFQFSNLIRFNSLDYIV